MALATNLFNMSTTTVEPKKGGNSDEYRVSYQKGKGNVYRSVIRFVPFYADPSKSIIQKSIAWIVNPVTQKGMYVDDPRSIGQPSAITDWFFKLRNTGVVAWQEFAKKHLGSKLQYAALVQIIQDEQQPELVGQIKVFKFGKKLWEKLYAEEHPAVGNGINPFHPIYGRYFSLVCTAQSGFNNFDQSQFLDNRDANRNLLPSGLYMKNAAGGLDQVNESSDQQAVFDYLAANSPDLAQYDYHPWTQDQQNHVDGTLSIISNYFQTGVMPSNAETLGGVAPAPAAAPMPGGIPVPAVPVSNSFTPPVNTAPVFPGATIPTAAPVAPAVPVAQPTVAPVVPGTMPMPAPVAQPTPVVSPVMPTPAPMPMPNMGPVNMGDAIPGTMPIPNAGAMPTVSGIEMPTVAPAVQPAQAPSIPGMGDLSDIIKNL